MLDCLAVDIISDLNLTTADSFEWDSKPTALFCIVAGGISEDMNVLECILEKLSHVYRGVFYIDGITEHSSIQNHESTILTITDICNKFSNVVYLYQHVVVLNNVAFIGLNGWNFPPDHDWIDKSILYEQKMQDIAYLSNAIKGLQNHKDVTKIVIISACIPAENFLFKQECYDSGLSPALTLLYDDSSLVKTWIFSGSEISIDVTYNNRRFVNNPCHNKAPYWPKRIVV